MATLNITPNPATTTQAATISWTDANGGWIMIEGPTARSFISAGSGDGSTTWWPPAVGTWTISLTDGKSKKKFDPRTLAQITVVVI